MRGLGMGKYADELVTTMNRAAESAVVEAKPLLVNAVKNMSVQDAKAILGGGPDAATQYFRRTTSAPLTDKFLPIVAKATQKVKLADKYNAFAGKGAKFGFVDAKDADLNQLRHPQSAGRPVPDDRGRGKENSRGPRRRGERHHQQGVRRHREISAPRPLRRIKKTPRCGAPRHPARTWRSG